MLKKKYTQGRNSRDETHYEKQIPNGGAGYYLLGLINHKTDKSSKAKEYFRKALELDPTLWCAFEKLSLYYHEMAVDECFPLEKQIAVNPGNKIDPNPPFKQIITSEIINANPVPIMNKEEVSNETKENMKNSTENKAQIYSPIHERESEEPQEIYTPTGTHMNPNYVTPTAHGKSSRRMNNIGNNAPHQLMHESRISGTSPSGNYKENNDSKYLGTNTGEHVIKPFKVTTPSNAGHQSNSKSSLSSKANKSREGYIGESIDLMCLLRAIGYAYNRQTNYECVEAIEAYKRLPDNQYKTGWVLTQVGC